MLTTAPLTAVFELKTFIAYRQLSLAAKKRHRHDFHLSGNDKEQISSSTFPRAGADRVSDTVPIFLNDSESNNEPLFYIESDFKPISIWNRTKCMCRKSLMKSSSGSSRFSYNDRYSILA